VDQIDWERDLGVRRKFRAPQLRELSGWKSSPPDQTPDVLSTSATPHPAERLQFLGQLRSVLQNVRSYPRDAKPAPDSVASGTLQALRNSRNATPAESCPSPCQNSDAESVLMHHRDIALFREVRWLNTGIVGSSTFYAARREHKRVCPTIWEPTARHSGRERGLVITVVGSPVAHAHLSGNDLAQHEGYR